MLADMVRPGVVVADIGTDHAYLSVYLLLRGLCPYVLACDLSGEALARAKRNVTLHGLEEQIELRLSDGLDSLRPEEAEDFVFAGMGSTLMVRLLARTPWIQNPQKRFLFQPMSRAEELRVFLCENGFKIQEENACTDEGRVYIALRAAYTGRRGGHSPAYSYIGELPCCEAPEAKLYLSRQHRLLKKRAEALSRAGTEPQEVFRLQGILSELENYL